VPSTTDENLERLAHALNELGARIRISEDEDGIPFDASPGFLRNVNTLNLTCEFGDFDIAFSPSGFDGFDELNLSSLNVTLGDVVVKVAGLADVIESKRAAGRPKDLAVLGTLEDFLRRRSRGIEIDL
jgi:hypothetical protein